MHRVDWIKVAAAFDNPSLITAWRHEGADDKLLAFYTVNKYVDLIAFVKEEFGSRVFPNQKKGWAVKWGKAFLRLDILMRELKMSPVLYVRLWGKATNGDFMPAQLGTIDGVNFISQYVTKLGERYHSPKQLQARLVTWSMLEGDRYSAYRLRSEYHFGAEYVENLSRGGLDELLVMLLEGDSLPLPYLLSTSKTLLEAGEDLHEYLSIKTSAALLRFEGRLSEQQVAYLMSLVGKGAN